MNIKVKYVGSQPVAIMGVGYSGIVDTGDVISINEQFFLEIKNFILALEDFKKIKGNLTNLHGLIIYTKSFMGDWDQYEKEKRNILSLIKKNMNIATPFISFLLTDQLDLQLQASKLEIAMKFPPKKDLGPIHPYPGSKKIRVAYFSFDFNNTPISFLTLGLFNFHDKNKFEIFGFSLNPQPADQMQQEIGRAHV